MKSTLVLMVFLFSNITLAKEVTIEVGSIKADKGKVYVQVDTNPKAFKTASEEDAFFIGIFQVKKKTLTFKLNIPDKTKIAVSVFHDENNNQKMDTNLVGIPKEGIGFSNVRRITKAYDFDDLATDKDKILIEMNY